MYRTIRFLYLKNSQSQFRKIQRQSIQQLVLKNFSVKQKHPFTNLLTSQEIQNDPSSSKYIYYQNDQQTNNVLRGHNNFESPAYENIYLKAIEDPHNYWSEQAKDVHWFKNYEQVLDQQDISFPKWFKGGEINITYNCIDRHVNEGRGDFPAIHAISAYTGVEKTYTYKQVLEEVGKLASVLKKQFGIKKGDRVVIYMPMIPQAAFSMLACARIGAIHSLVFGGFAAKELANRIDDCQPSLIITASKGIEPNKKVEYIQVVNQALTYCKKIDNAQTIKKLYYNRTELDGQLKVTDEVLQDKTYIEMNQLIALEKEIAQAESLPSNHPIYILYTSGTTGDPKGVVRDHGGTSVALNYSLKTTFDFQYGMRFFAASDFGWIVGHSLMVYGSLLRSCASVIFEGKPITPNAGILWKICDNYKINQLFLTPTAVREIVKVDYNGDLIKNYNMKSVNIIHVAGERCDSETMWWLRKQFPNVLLNDTWWPTENGWPMGSNMLNQDIYGPIFPTLPGSITKITPGWDVRILNEKNEECARDVLGRICIKLPAPPSHTMTIWGNDQRYINSYLKENPGYYIVGDEGIIDKKGYLHVLGRIDDVINVAGHRLDTGRIEEVIVQNKNVIETAVIGLNHKSKGEVPIAIIVLKESLDQKQKQEMIDLINFNIRTDIGPISRLEGVLFVEKLPKTRTGKTLRRIVKNIINEEPYKEPSTIEDIHTLDPFKIMSINNGYEKAVFIPNQSFKPIQN